MLPNDIRNTLLSALEAEEQQFASFSGMPNIPDEMVERDIARVVKARRWVNAQPQVPTVVIPDEVKDAVREWLWTNRIDRDRKFYDAVQKWSDVVEGENDEQHTE